MSPEADTPAERAGAVLRAAEAAAAAAAAAGATQPARNPGPDAQPAAHELGAPARLLAATGELEARVAQARAQLDALQGALDRVARAGD